MQGHASTCSRLLACLAWLALPTHAADPAPPELIDPARPEYRWKTFRVGGDTCVMAGTAVSEKRDDAFEVQFRRSRAQKLRFFALIPRLRSGGSVYIESPTTRDRWRIPTDNLAPALEGPKAEAIHRNSISGIPIAFDFEYARGKRVKYETAPTNAVVAATDFVKCVEFIERPPEPKKKH